MLEQLDIAIGFTVVMLLLSLFITVVVQAVSAASDLRGRNLVWGLTKLFHHISPEFQTKAARGWNELRSSVGKKLAEAVATHPMLKQELSGRAKAIRLDELLTVLQDLALKPPDDLDEDAKRMLQDWARKIAPNPETLAFAETLLARIDQAVPGRSAELRRLVEQSLGTASRLEAAAERWFDDIMERTSDVFLRWTKAITIVCAFVLAIGFHVDSIDIYKQISTTASVRAKLGSIADETGKQASDVLVLDTRRIAAAAAKIRAKHAEDDKAQALGNMPAFQRCGDAENWLFMEKVDGGVIGEFQAACQQEAMDQIGALGASLSSLRASLDETGLSFRNYSARGGWWASYMDPERGSPLAHVLGVLATAFLLSLGGPFWYNTLRQLCSLKAPTPRKIEQEQQLATVAAAQAAAHAAANPRAADH